MHTPRDMRVETESESQGDETERDKGPKLEGDEATRNRERETEREEREVDDVEQTRHCFQSKCGGNMDTCESIGWALIKRSQFNVTVMLPPSMPDNQFLILIDFNLV